MNSYVLSLGLACVLALAFTGCATTTGRNTAWEYKVLNLRTSDPHFDPTTQLNELAQQGWMVVSSSVLSTDPYFNGQVFVFVLKRPRQ
jgi:hypothetical protein